MHHCLYDSNCKNERTLDFEFCIPHLQTPRGRQHVLESLAEGDLTLPSQVEDAIKNATAIPDEDYQTTALEKMSEALDRILEWEDAAKRRLHQIPERDWRYEDRKGSEQTRTEVSIYERALDRTARHVSSMTKAAFQEKLITLGKAQVEMMIRIMMSVVTELKLDSSTTDKARLVLLEKLQTEANLVPQVENVAQQALETSSSSQVRMRGEVIA